MKIHELNETLICIIQDQINRDNAIITLIQETNKKREQLLLKLCDYDTDKKKHGDLPDYIQTFDNKGNVLYVPKEGFK